MICPIGGDRNLCPRSWQGMDSEAKEHEDLLQFAIREKKIGSRTICLKEGSSSTIEAAADFFVERSRRGRVARR